VLFYCAVIEMIESTPLPRLYAHVKMTRHSWDTMVLFQRCRHVLRCRDARRATLLLILLWCYSIVRWCGFVVMLC